MSDLLTCAKKRWHIIAYRVYLNQKKKAIKNARNAAELVL